MTSARDFCRIPDLPFSIFLTYAFDPIFFERVPWHDLVFGGRRRVVVVADSGRIAEAIRSCSGQIAYLGRSYVLAETSQSGVFHPKLIARLSKHGGRVWLGSGNLTYTGWGGNRELATSWAVGPKEADSGAWLNDVLDRTARSIGSTAFADQIRDIRAEVPWLAQAAPQTNPPVLMGSEDMPLAPQLAARWRGRRFEHVRICTGSTDAGGAFLNWAKRTFGIERVTLCLNLANSSFDPPLLEKLRLDISIIPAPPEQMLHAKFYWFEGSDGPAAVMGSANCSAAAWLAGNVETIVVYDNPIKKDFRAILELFAGQAHKASEILELPVAVAVEETSDDPSHRIVSLRLRPSNLVEAAIEPSLRDDAAAFLRFVGPDGINLRLSRRKSEWVTRLPDDFKIGLMPLFASVEGTNDGNTFWTRPRWVDNDTLLARATGRTGVDANLEALSRTQFSARDDQRIIETIQAVATELLAPSRHSARVGGSSPGKRQHDAETGGSAVRTVDPARMLKDLRDINRGKDVLPYAHGGHATNLSGVIALLFEQEEVRDLDLTRESWSSNDPSDSNDPDQEAPPREDHRPSDQKSRDAAEAVRSQLAQFLDKLAKIDFAERTTPSQMVQAIAFPLLVCVRATEAGWLNPEFMNWLASRVVGIMFDQSYGAKEPRGLIANVRRRYARADELERFLGNVGDGTLWLVLLAALKVSPTQALPQLVTQASAVTSVYLARDLLARSDPQQLSLLLRRISIQNAESHVIDGVERIANAVCDLNALLKKMWPTLSHQLKTVRSLQPARALLWRQELGWHVTAESPAETYQQGYINIETAAANYPEIEAALTRLKKMVAS